jgi:hypothetical protein
MFIYGFYDLFFGSKCKYLKTEILVWGNWTLDNRTYIKTVILVWNNRYNVIYAVFYRFRQTQMVIFVSLSFGHFWSQLGEPKTKAMRKDFFSGFSIFAKDETKFFPYLNLNPKLNRASVLTKISRNKWGSKCETWIHENDSKILEVRNHCTKIIEYFEYFFKITNKNGPIWTQFRL